MGLFSRKNDEPKKNKAYLKAIEENKQKNIEIGEVKKIVKKIADSDLSMEEKVKQCIDIASEHMLKVQIPIKTGEFLVFIPNKVNDEVFVDIELKRPVQEKNEVLLKHIWDLNQNKNCGYNKEAMEFTDKIMKFVKDRELVRNGEYEYLKTLPFFERGEFKRNMEANEAAYEKEKAAMFQQVFNCTYQDIVRDELEGKYEIGEPCSDAMYCFIDKNADALTPNRCIMFGIPSKDKEDLSIVIMNMEKNGKVFLTLDDQKIEYTFENMQKVYDFFKKKGCINTLDIKTKRYSPYAILENTKKQAIIDLHKSDESCIKMPILKKDIYMKAYINTISLNQAQSLAKKFKNFYPLTLFNNVEKDNQIISKVFMSPEDGLLYYKGKEGMISFGEKGTNSIFTKVGFVKFEYFENDELVSKKDNYIVEELRENGTSDFKNFTSQRERSELVAEERQRKKDPQNDIDKVIEDAKHLDDGKNIITPTSNDLEI